MRLKNLDLLVMVTIAMLNIVSAQLSNRNPAIAVILALPLVFVLPGYTLTAAAFQKRTLNVSYRVLLSLGLSLAIDVLSGLSLNLFPFGLQMISWAMLLGLLTVVFSFLAAYLRRGVPVNGKPSLKLNLSISGGILFGLAITVAMLSVLYSAIGAEQQPHPGFTQFWMLPSVQAQRSCAVRLGVQSFEPASVAYRITMTIDGTQVIPSPPIIIAPQQEWSQLVSVTSSVTGSVFVNARLYRLDKPETIYREAHLTLDSCTRSKLTSTPFSALSNTYNGNKTKQEEHD